MGLDSYYIPMRKILTRYGLNSRKRGPPICDHLGVAYAYTGDAIEILLFNKNIDSEWLLSVANLAESSIRKE